MLDYFGKECGDLAHKKLYLLDMDGTIYRESQLFPGVKEFLADIEKSGDLYVFITNNSSKSVRDYVQKVRDMGIETDEQHFFTSIQAAMVVLKKEVGDGLIYAQGTRSFLSELKESGFNVTDEYTVSAKAVLVGFDPELTGEKLRNTCHILTECDIPFYATNPDWVCPVEFGYVPDCGSMCFGIEKATGKRPVFIGKPAPFMILTMMEKFKVKAEDTVVIGDRLYTDIASGVNANVDTVCVLSGEATLDDIARSDVKPTYVLENVAMIRGN